MKYANIKYCDIANGPGVRTSLFVSGCNHRCPGCFNEIAWDFNYGKEFTEDTIKNIIDSLKDGFVKGLTLLGGEPLDPKNQRCVLELIKEVRNVYNNTKSIWCYTGYLYEDLLGKTEYINEILNNIDVLVDGPFILDKKKITLVFTGSSNQRIIDMKETLKNDKIILWKYE